MAGAPCDTAGAAKVTPAVLIRKPVSGTSDELSVMMVLRER